MGGGPNLNFRRTDAPPDCYEQIKFGARGSVCLRLGCTPACVACHYSRPKNTPACFKSMPGFPEDCVSSHFLPECKRFCRYAQSS
ncbi:hypothetical protein [Desulforamulus aquiferis]|uniref:Uncharacterized protein n=1 Tax=Desulforamulus aquiferis TaxID=1397668 RepID=A0AAW7ZDI2_9FIRM|nr:hypothetical protein [Desulforamulus aquiferis]MDO7787214.1 hypothetical protein [Desulforamulus aquiferis]RYD02723.1 hypothetical protein N752_23370 [Desulforamulus aquiferis]